MFLFSHQGAVVEGEDAVLGVGQRKAKVKRRKEEESEEKPGETAVDETESNEDKSSEAGSGMFFWSLFSNI